MPSSLSSLHPCLLLVLSLPLIPSQLLQHVITLLLWGRSISVGLASDNRKSLHNLGMNLLLQLKNSITMRAPVFPLYIPPRGKTKVKIPLGQYRTAWAALPVPSEAEGVAVVGRQGYKAEGKPYSKKQKESQCKGKGTGKEVQLEIDLKCMKDRNRRNNDKRN